MVAAIKALGLQMAIVSNGSNNSDRSRRQADHGGRLGTALTRLGDRRHVPDMHRPRRDGDARRDLCRCPAAKKANPRVSWGFSFIVCWPGLTDRRGQPLASNVAEIALAAAWRTIRGSTTSRSSRCSSGATSVGGDVWPAGESPAGAARRGERATAGQPPARGPSFRVVVSENLPRPARRGHGRRAAHPTASLPPPPLPHRAHDTRRVRLPGLRDDPRSLLASGDGYSKRRRPRRDARSRPRTGRAFRRRVSSAGTSAASTTTPTGGSKMSPPGRVPPARRSVRRSPRTASCDRRASGRHPKRARREMTATTDPFFPS